MDKRETKGWPLSTTTKASLMVLYIHIVHTHTHAHIAKPMDKRVTKGWPIIQQGSDKMRTY